MSQPFPGAGALAELAASGPDDLAILVDGGRDLTFGDWERCSSRLARGLVQRDVRAGDRVALRFDAAHWAAFCVSYVGVLKAGAVTVLVPAGLAAPDADRIVRHADVRGVLCPPLLAPGAGAAWVAAPEAVECDGGGDRWFPPVADPAAPAEIIYPLVPLTRPRPWRRTHGDLASRARPSRPGCFAHAWAPGSSGGQHALAQVLGGAGTSLATLARFSPDRLCALIDRLGPSTLGLTPPLAAALASSGGGPSPGARAVTAVLLSGGRADPALRADLGSAFPRAAVIELDLDLDQAGARRPAGEQEPAPAGASQLGMVWHEQLSPGSFNLPGLVRRYRGHLDVAALDQALGALIRRHDPLRTTFDLMDGLPRQVVAPAETFQLPVVDLTDLSMAAAEAETARLVADASTRTFDLVTDPPFAPLLVRLAGDDHVLVVRLHHTAFDDWSVEVFRRDLSALYAAVVTGQPPSLPRLDAGFADVCRRQQARLAGEAGDRQRSWWRAQMDGAPLAVQLPLGEHHQIGPDRPGAGEPLRHDLSPALSSRVRALAPVLRATPFMTVLAAFEVLLRRRTGQDDLVIASVVAGRGATALEPMIGCFTKKVLLRLRLDGDPTFPELVARTRTTVLDALAHQDLPFEAVVQDTLGRFAAVHGIAAQVPIVFQGETPQQARLVLPGLEVGPFEVPASARREQHFSGRPDPAAGDPTAGDPVGRPAWGEGAGSGAFLLLSLLEGADGLAFVARGVFHRPAAQRLLLELEALLADVAEDPGRRVSALGPAPHQAPPTADVLALGGLRLDRHRIEAALSRCTGVAEVAVAVAGEGSDARLVAYAVARGPRPPTLSQLRAALWAGLPGSPWPAAAVVLPVHSALPRLPDGRLDVTALPPVAPRPEPPDPETAMLSALWARGSEGAPGDSYWQDFSFLQSLAEARAAGLPITDEQVARCRTPEMLATAIAAAALPPNR